MLSHAPRGLRAKSVFFEQFNDIDVFVEDASRETKKLFARLLSRVLGEHVKLDCVFPLGPRDAVLEACEGDQAPGGRRRVYVIDADLDLCCCQPAPALVRLYRLPRYNIENFLIDEMAASAIIARESDSMDEEAAKRQLDFDQWTTRNAAPLKRLFIAFAAARALAPRLKTVGIGYSRLVSDDSGNVDPLKIESLITELRLAVDALHTGGDFDSEMARLNEVHQLKGDVDFMLHYVSGKHYLLPLLRLRMNVIVRIQRSLGLLKIHLAECVGQNELVDILAAAS